MSELINDGINYINFDYPRAVATIINIALLEPHCICPCWSNKCGHRRTTEICLRGTATKLLAGV